MPPWSKTASTVVPLSSATHVPAMSLLKKKNQPAPMAITATTATITQVKGLFVAAAVTADVAEATWAPVDVACLRGIGLAWLVAGLLQGEPHVPQNFAPALIFEPHRGQKLIAMVSP